MEYDPVPAGRTSAYGETGRKRTDHRLGEPGATIRSSHQEGPAGAAAASCGCCGRCRRQRPLCCATPTHLRPVRAVSPVPLVASAEGATRGQDSLRCSCLYAKGAKFKCSCGAGTERALPTGRCWQEPAACPVSGRQDRSISSSPLDFRDSTLTGRDEAAMARHERFGVPAHSRALLRGLKMDEGASAKDMPGNMDQLAPP
jgi:hypothetical protein